MVRSRMFVSALRSTGWALVALAAIVSLSARAARAQYSWLSTTSQTGNWNVSTRWTGGAAGTFPNLLDATATLNQPLSSAASGNYNVQISNTPGQLITIGGLTVNNYVGLNDTANLRIGANGNGSITFQTSSAPAFYTENVAPGTENTGAGTTSIFAPITFASDTVITQNHATNNNGGTSFTSNANSPGGTTAAPGITVTKEGAANVEFNVAPSGAGTGFQGALVINNGAVRDTANVFQNASSVTVNAGGQYQLGATIADWNLGSSAVLNLNGSGKASGASSQGALRFNNATAVGNFNNPVNLQSNAFIDIVGATAQLTLTKEVSGAGGLIKTDPGTLVLGGTAASTYAGATQVRGGTLLLAKPGGTTALPGDVTVQGVSNTTQGILKLAANEQVADAAKVTLVQSTGTGTPNGLFALNGFNETIGALASIGGAGIVQNGAAEASSTLSINAAQASSFTGLVQDGAAATLALALSGSQSFELTGANTYSGGTTVNGGTLVANNATGSATGTGPVTVNAGGALGGSGFIGGAVTFVGGTLAPGNSPGTLSLGSTSLDAASSLLYQLDTPGVAGSGVNDLTEVSGDLSLAGTLNLVPLPGFGAGVYRLFDYTGALTNNGLSIAGVPSGFQAALDLSVPNQVNLSVNQVPEPSTLILASVGLMFAAAIRRAGRRANDI